VTDDDGLFTADFATTPYWWDEAPPLKPEPGGLPAKVDVAIVGAGITGLNAALPLARAGRSVAVLDAGDLGQGASSRNAGYVGRSLKHSFRALARRFGIARAVAVYREMQAAFDTVSEVITSEQIACRFKRCGRLVLARSRAQFDDLGEELSLRREHLGDEFELIQRDRLHEEIATHGFRGGAVIPDNGSLHPGLYQRGLLERARSAGVRLSGDTAVTRIEPLGKGPGFSLTAQRGRIAARDVLVATNGYSGAAFPWLQRRLIPFDAYMIATEPLTPAVMERVLPKDRTVIDHAFNIVFLRRSPDGSRLLFGGRTGSRSTGLKAKAAELHRLASGHFPGIADIKIGHAWTGRCAATFDLYPHVGTKDGIHFAGGYCFAGVPMGTYLGRKSAQRILGAREGETVFAERPFPTVPLYTGNPWFVPQAMAVYDMLDRWAGRR
jgi:glycine/D-amino acid oxidase-like deaminating enzyme